LSSRGALPQSQFVRNAEGQLAELYYSLYMRIKASKVLVSPRPTLESRVRIPLNAWNFLLLDPYICTVISLKSGWILIQCWHHMRIPTHICTRRHTHINTHTAHPIPPQRGVLSQELNGVGWPVPFPSVLHTTR